MSGPGVWSTEAWRQAATTWIDARLAEAGIARTGAVEQPRVRPWATVLRVPTGAGVFWLKAAAPETAFEVPLYPLLHRGAPNSVLIPLAVDAECGWMLLPDGGTHLRDVVEGEELVAAMATVLPHYAELQRAMAAEVEPMLELGMLDARPAALADRFGEALAAARCYVERMGSAEDRETLARLEALGDTVAADAARLGASPVPASIDHSDLHPGNVLVSGPEAFDDARIYDWGDSVIAHPFASMLVPLRAIRYQLGCAIDDPRLLRLRDVYLEAWGDLGSRKELIATLELACHLGKIARSLVWERSLRIMPEGEAHEHADAPFGWLTYLLEEHGWLGGSYAWTRPPRRRI